MPEPQLRLAVFGDATPVREEIVSSGMTRLNTRVGEALLPWLERMIAGTGGNYFQLADVAPALQSRTRLVALPRFVTRYAGRVFPVLRRNRTAYRLRLPALARDLRRRHVDWLVCPCGGNPEELEFVVALARRAGVRLALYLVDDFALGAELDGGERARHLARESVPVWLGAAHHLFSVSEGMRERLQNVYGLPSTLLPLPYRPQPRATATPPPARQGEILFLGSLSHFYHEPLRLMAKVIDELNREQGAQLTLRLTLASTDDARRVIGVYHCIRSEPLSDPVLLARAVRTSLICYAPYAFSPQYAGMVTCSFPSKLMDYLCHGRFILVHSPAYGSAARYFREYHLPEVVTSMDAADLKTSLHRQLAQPRDLHQPYQTALTAHHAYEHFAGTIVRALTGAASS